MDDAALSATRLNMSPRLRRFLHLAGSGLALVATVFVALRAREYWRGLEPVQVSAATWTLLVALALVYGAANLLLASAWRHLLLRAGVRATHMWTSRVYGISQLAKYVPGNVFHLAGRQAIGMAAGAPGRALAQSTAAELVSLALAGMLFGLLVLPLLAPGFPLQACVTVFLGTVWLVAYSLFRFLGPYFAASFIRQLLFLAISGAVFVIVLGAVAGASKLDMQDWVLIGAAYVVAWLAGLLTPGAPAGVGVRELVLLLLLKGIVADADMLSAVLLGRFVTVVGDVLFFVAALLIPASRNALAESHG